MQLWSVLYRLVCMTLPFRVGTWKGRELQEQGHAPEHCFNLQH